MSMSMSMSYFPCIEYLRNVEAHFDTSVDSVTEELKLWCPEWANSIIG